MGFLYANLPDCSFFIAVELGIKSKYCGNYSCEAIPLPKYMYSSYIIHTISQLYYYAH